MRYLYTFIILLLTLTTANAQSKEGSEFEKKVQEWAKNYSRPDCQLKPSKLKSCTIDDEREVVTVEMNGGFSGQYFTPIVVDTIYEKVRSFIPRQLRGYDLEIIAEGHPIEFLVPNFFRKGKKDESRLSHQKYNKAPWVKNVSRPYTAKDGLEGNHIAVWASHGRYVRENDTDWWWQRPRLFCTTEDLFSQTFVIPYIIPMLENAGAVVFTPRERDWQNNEVIVDNDLPNKDGSYSETMSLDPHMQNWQPTPYAGFANTKQIYTTNDAPFSDGSARYIPTVQSPKQKSVAQWMPDIPETGRYAVYVTYQSYENSVEDAHYTVYHKGGMTEIRVNQRIGGGIWVYLGTFEFKQGERNSGMVTLSNISGQKGIVTADAVRFGGGMGNVVPQSEDGSDEQIQPSGLPRWAEGAKYSALWYGFPYKIHTEPFGRNDYNNDINVRSAIVNYLMGRSIYHPNREDGLGVPLDLTVAFHTDAGATKDDERIGSLSIYRTEFNEGKTGAGLDRYVSRDIASILLTNLTSDLKKYDWHVRELRNGNYGEAREPMSPVCILEMLSHQNFADMKLAYDPQFKFDFCRSVYKSIVKFIATQHSRSYTIQPLPVSNFNIELNENKRTAILSWNGENDPLEPSAKPDAYIVYTRVGNNGFDNGQIVKGNKCSVELQPDLVYSFKVTALNSGGESFPSEVLSAGVSSHNKGTVLVVNAFTRLEGPAVIDTKSQAGFDIMSDPGVPYGAFAGYCGNQKSFDRSKWGGETGNALGVSGNEYEGLVMMGNTFDYAAIHGHGIMSSKQHSFTSCSEASVLNGNIKLNDYHIVDVIYGVQKTFDQRLNNMLAKYANNKGKLIISAANTGCVEIGGQATNKLTDKAMTNINGCGLNFSIYREMNSKFYSVPSPTVLSPNAPAFAILTYQDGSIAAIAQQGRFVRLGFPLEAITDKTKMNLLMGAFLEFLK